jgi:hypothetical protein
MEWLMFVAGLAILVGFVMFVRWAARKGESEDIYDVKPPAPSDDPIAMANIADKVGPS